MQATTAPRGAPAPTTPAPTPADTCAPPAPTPTYDPHNCPTEFIDQDRANFGATIDALHDEFAKITLLGSGLHPTQHIAVHAFRWHNYPIEHLRDANKIASVGLMSYDLAGVVVVRCRARRCPDSSCTQTGRRGSQDRRSRLQHSRRAGRVARRPVVDRCGTVRANTSSSEARRSPRRSCTAAWRSTAGTGARSTTTTPTCSPATPRDPAPAPLKSLSDRTPVRTRCPLQRGQIAKSPRALASGRWRPAPSSLRPIAACTRPW